MRDTAPKKGPSADAGGASAKSADFAEAVHEEHHRREQAGSTAVGASAQSAADAAFATFNLRMLARYFAGEQTEVLWARLYLPRHMCTTLLLPVEQFAAVWSTHIISHTPHCKR